MISPRHISVERASKLAGTSGQHIRDEIARGRIPADRKPGVFLIRLEEFLEYLDQKASPVKPSANPAVAPAAQPVAVEIR